MYRSQAILAAIQFIIQHRIRISIQPLVQISLLGPRLRTEFEQRTVVVQEKIFHKRPTYHWDPTGSEGVEDRIKIPKKIGV